MSYLTFCLEHRHVELCLKSNVIVIVSFYKIYGFRETEFEFS